MEGLERKWWTLIAVCTAIFMLLLDITVVNVALPDIQRDLDASFAQLQWVIDAYALTLATTVLAAGSLADLFGRRRVFTIGLVLFTAASFGCGIANDAGVLIGARAVQGVGGGVMFAVSLALLANAFHGRERGNRVRDLGRDDRRRRRDRPARRRRAHRVGRLALDLLRQHPDRHRRDRRDAAARRRVEEPRRAHASTGSGRRR